MLFQSKELTQENHFLEDSPWMKGVFQGITSTQTAKTLTTSPSQSSQPAKHQKETTNTTSRDTVLEKALNVPHVYIETEETQQMFEEDRIHEEENICQDERMDVV